MMGIDEAVSLLVTFWDTDTGGGCSLDTVDSAGVDTDLATVLPPLEGRSSFCELDCCGCFTCSVVLGEGCAGADGWRSMSIQLTSSFLAVIALIREEISAAYWST